MLDKNNLSDVGGVQHFHINLIHLFIYYFIYYIHILSNFDRGPNLGAVIFLIIIVG